MNKQWDLLRKNQSVRALWLGETISSFGDFFYDIAIMWYVFSKTGSGLQTALVMVLTFLPQAVMGPFLGVLADRMNRKRLMQLGSFVQACLMGVLTLLIYFKVASIVEIYIITVLMAIFQLVYTPARSGMFPDIVPVDQLMTANALFSMSQQTARLIGSTSGGAIIALAGAAPAVGLDAVTFLVSVICVGRIPHIHRSRDASVGTSSMIRDLSLGWQWLLSKRALLVLISIGTLSNIALGPTNVLPPMLIKNDLHANAAALGVFDASIGLGMLLAGVLLGSLSVRHVGRLFSLGIGLQGIAMVIVALSPVLWIACAGNFVLGVAVVTTILPMSTMFQILIPGDMRGRINAISSSLFTIFIPITYGGVGILGDAVGARWSYGFGAALLLLCMTVGMMVPSLRKQTLLHERFA